MKINTRQLSIIIFYMLISLKFLALPSLIYLDIKSDAIWVYVLMSIIDISIVWIVLWIIRSSHEESFLSFLKHRFGTIISKIICIMCLLSFFFDIFEGVIGIQKLLLHSLYNNLSIYLYLFPLLITISLLCYRGLRNIGRVCEVFVWVIIVTLIFIILKSLDAFDPTFFLPMFSKGIGPVFKSLFKHASWFGTPFAILFFMGDIDFSHYKKRTVWKYILLAIFEILILVSTFYGVFKITSSSHSFALADLTQVSNDSSALDELTWVALSFWIIAQVIQLSIFFYATVKAFRYTFEVKNSWLPIFILDILLVICDIIDYNTINIENSAFSTPVLIFEMIVKLGFTIIFMIANFIYLKSHKGREYVKD